MEGEMSKCGELAAKLEFLILKSNNLEVLKAFEAYRFELEQGQSLESYLKENKGTNSEFRMVLKNTEKVEVMIHNYGENSVTIDAVVNFNRLVFREH